MCSMRATVMSDGGLHVREIPIPVPQRGEVLVKTLATGICGSDLHTVSHAPELVAGLKAVTGSESIDISQPVVLGHEFCAEVVEHGPDTRKNLPIGTRVVSFPLLPRETPTLIGFGNVDVPGGYAQHMLLSEPLLLPVPGNLSDDTAALTEPMAVGLHTVNRAAMGPEDVPVVIGCGPIGLAVIAVLKMRGIGPIVAADFSPARRALAARFGADVVVDPTETSPYESWQQLAAAQDPTQHGRQTLLFPNYAFRPSVVFECVGVPGVIQQILAGAPACSKIVVAGLCMEADTFYPSFGVLKEVDVIFAVYYTVEEYAQTLHHLASGELKVDGMVTGHVGLDGVEQAYADLANPETHVKIIINPGSS
jgi:threonine dehydrogenase-like Zn-dependent dehydrogenase